VRLGWRRAPPAAGAPAGSRSTAVRSTFHPTEVIHGYLAYTLFALVSMHLFTALWHQFV
jgi:cytochrome b561